MKEIFSEKAIIKSSLEDVWLSFVNFEKNGMK
jgi:hypothetical protein